MRKFFNAAVLIPLAVIFVIFAVANRREVTVSFDPFNSQDSALSLTMPLFAVIIAVAILGVIAGGCATWFSQRRWRRAARLHEADARELRSQLTDARAGLAASRREQSLPVGIPQGGYRRDKQGATL